MKLLALVPRPNQPGDTDNYFNVGTQRFNRNNLDAKVNWNRNTKHQVWFKYSVMDALVHGDFGLGAGRWGMFVRRWRRRRPHAGPDRRHRANLHLLAHLPVGRDARLDPIRPEREVSGSRHQLRIGHTGNSGTNGPDPRESGMPAFNPGSDYSTLGNTEGWNPLFRNDQSYTFNSNASWMKGAHEIRFGFDFVHHLMNHWQPELGDGPRGSFSFGNRITALNPAAIASDVGFQGGTPSFENGWNGLAGFLLGTPTSSGKSTSSSRWTAWRTNTPLRSRPVARHLQADP